jgi:hypothetical protein
VKSQTEKEMENTSFQTDRKKVYRKHCDQAKWEKFSIKEERLMK